MLKKTGKKRLYGDNWPTPGSVPDVDSGIIVPNGPELDVLRFVTVSETRFRVFAEVANNVLDMVDKGRIS